MSQLTLETIRSALAAMKTAGAAPLSGESPKP